MHDVLVTETWNLQEQNVSRFTASDRGHELTFWIGHWWPQGPPTAGMAVTLWEHYDAGDGTFRVDRWIDLSHGTGPAPDGPYARVRLLDATSGKVPEHRMAWVIATPFALDPQNGGDGDIHVQTFSACPAAGLTTETTPPLRGYVDHPALPGLSSSTDTSDEPSSHLADAPPPGVPVMILGALRYDYGFGWWEIHPIRAWRFLTAAEDAQLGRDCAGDPVPHFDQGPTLAGERLPVPFGVPPCTDGSEFGNPGGIYAVGCAPQCYVAHTAIGQRETLAGGCPPDVQPVVTPSQTRWLGKTIGRLRGAATVPRGGDEDAVREAAREQPLVLATALARTYGGLCAAVRTGDGAFPRCLDALARLAGGETRSPRDACAREPSAARDGCETAARALLRRAAATRARQLAAVLRP